MLRSPYYRSSVHGLLTAALMIPLAIYLSVAEMWGTVHLQFPLLVLVVVVLLLNAFAETARGLWPGVICALLFAVPVIVACFALSWYYWRAEDAYLRAELRFVAAVSGGLSIVVTPLALRFRRNESHDA